jgi:hypothetical protein
MARTQEKTRGVRARTATSGRKNASRKPADQVLDLQRTAGNRAVVGLLTSVQRSPDIGWDDAAADKQGVSWNSSPSKVPGTNIVRYPIDHLTQGNQQAYAKDYQVKDKKTGEMRTVHVNAGEKKRTTESAAGRAIALVPSTLKTTQPVHVMVHLHGFTGRTGLDPYAGWRQQTVGADDKKDHIPPGKKVGDATVRDVDWDQIPQQMANSGNSQLMAILPQGVGRSEFGKFEQTSYIDEVMGRLKPVVPWQDAPKDVRVVMSAHSGGGSTVIRMLGARGGLPASVGTVVLFEAMNTPEQAKKVWEWVEGHLERLTSVVSTNGGTASKDKDAAVDAAPRLRAYSSKKSRGYSVRQGRVKEAISRWFAGEVPSDFVGGKWKARSGGPPQLGVYADRMKSLFQVEVDLAGDHETIVRGNLRDALMAVPRATGKAPPGGTQVTPPGGTQVTPPGGTQVTPPGPTGGTQSSSTAVASDLAGLAAMVGHDEKELTNELFFLRHEELNRRKIRPEEKGLAREWITIRDGMVRPFLAQARATTGSGGKGGPIAIDTSGNGAGRRPEPTGPDTTKSGPDTGTASGDRSAADKKGIAAATEQALAGGAKEDVDALAAALADNDTTVEDWFAGHEPSATFMGLSIKPSGASKVGGVHREMVAALKRAEADLLSQYPGSTPEQVAEELKLYSLVGLRRPKKATGGTLPSYHCFGLAVDINYKGNPFVGQSRGSKATKAAGDAAADVVRYATLLMSGTEGNIRADPASRKKATKTELAGEQWERLHSQSDAVKAYLSLTDKHLESRVGDGVGGHDLAWWRDRQAKDRIEGGRGAWGGHDNAQTHGFMDLAKNLVIALTAAGLKWGGMYGGGKDIMHFDLRSGTVRHRT